MRDLVWHFGRNDAFNFHLMNGQNTFSTVS